MDPVRDADPAVTVRPATAADHDRLREIAVAAKASWGYEPSRVREWAETGIPSPALAAGDVLVASVDGDPVAWASVVPGDDCCELNDLWVDPAWMGVGIGSQLFAAAATRALQHGARALEWEAEPNAVPFYEKLGGRYLRESEPTAWGRVIPVMRLDLGDADPAAHGVRAESG